MKRFLIILPMLFAATAAGADDMTRHSMAMYSVNMHRMEPSTMTCAELQSELRSGSAVLHWTASSGMPRWGKYMSHGGWCKMQGMKARVSVKASDGSCRLYQCNQYGRSPSR